MERVRDAAGDERRRTRRRATAKKTAIDHSRIQTKWGIARKRRKRTVSRGRSRSSVTTMRTGCSGSSEYGSASSGSERRIARREQEEVRARLRRVAERVRGEVAQPARRAAAHEDREPGEERGGGRDAADRRDVPPVRAPRCRSTTPSTTPWPDEPLANPPPSAVASRSAGSARTSRKKPAPATLADGRVDLHVDRVVLLDRGTTDTGSRRGTRTRSPASRSGGTTATKSCVLSGTSPWTSTASQFTKATTNAAMPRSDDPDEERDREEDPEHHREPAALEVVADDESDRSRAQRSPRQHSPARARPAVAAVFARGP